MVIQIAYGDKIWNTIGTELVGLNKEAVGFIEENLHKFWFVDIFHFRKYLIFDLGGGCLTRFQYALYPAGCLVPNFSMYDTGLLFYH